MPTPNPGEARDGFVDRCIPIVLEDGTATDGDEAVAICHSLYDQAQSEATMSDKRTDRQDIDYKSLPGFETKTIPTFVKNVDEAQGIVEHIISVFGIVDDGRDVVMPGSFAKTIAEHGSRVRVLDQHNYDSALRTVGRPISIREIGRDDLPLEVTAQYPAATGGVLATTQYALDTDNGRNMFALVAGGFLPETSIGYDALDTEEEFREIDGDKVAVRLLKTIRLWEYSNVIWGMNPATSTVSAKGKETDAKVVSGSTNLPLADRDRAWDAAAAIQGVRRVTDSAEEPSAQYRNGFFWFDGETPELYTSYKFPFADDIGGELTAVPRAIFAGAARLDGSDIPDADKDRIRSRMSRYYARMREQFDDENIVPPWEKAKEATPDDHDYLGVMMAQFCGLVRSNVKDEWIADRIIDIIMRVPVETGVEAKVGRAISGARVKRIRGAIGKARDALDDLDAMLAEVEPVDDSDKQQAAPQSGAADDSDVDGAGPDDEPPTSEADLLMIQVHKLKTREYDTLEVTE